MKKLFFITTFILCLLLSGTAFAAMPTIKADKQYFDISTGLHVLSGHVYIQHNSRVVTAGQAKTNLIEVWGSGGVTFTQDDMFFSGDTVYAYFPKDRIQIDGGVVFKRTGLEIKADRVEFNWKTKLAVFTGCVSVSRDNEANNYESVTYNVEQNSIQ